jgi:ribosomal protein S18 acetylase RimI-like enzyme
MAPEAPLAFRPFEAGDLPLLEAWLAEARLGAPAGVSRRALLRRLLEDERILVFAAERDGAVVGFARLDLAPDRSAELTLIVDPGRRRRGAGRALLLRVLEEARSRGLRRLVAVVAHANEVGRAFFAEVGFEPSDVRVPGFDHLERVVHRSDREEPLEIVP